MMKKILLLGGTGAIGGNLGELAGEAGWDVYVTSRSPQINQEGIHYILGNAKDEDFVSEILQTNFDVVVDFMIYETSDFLRRVSGLLSCCSQYIFLSSARVYAASDVMLTEESPRLLDVSKDDKFLSTDEYALKKARQEDCLFNCGKDNWTIIRPYITYGMERLQLGVLEKEAWLYRALRGKTVVFSEDMLRCHTTLTHGRDVARAIAKLIGESSALGEAFHITGATSCNWESILGIYRRAINDSGLEVKLKNVGLDSFSRCHNGTYQIIYDRLYNRVFNNNKIDQFIDTTGFVSVEEGLYQSTIDFLQNPRFLQIDWSGEGAKDKITCELTDVREIGDLKNTLRYLKYRFIK